MLLNKQTQVEMTKSMMNFWSSRIESPPKILFSASRARVKNQQ